MRKISILFSFLILALVSAEAQKVSIFDLDKQRDGNYWQRGGMRPFSGEAIEDWPNKKKKVRSKFKNGKLHGKTETWYKNGKKQSEMTYEMGKQIGVEKQWYENGNLKLQIAYQNTKPHGSLKEYYEDGKLKSEGNYTYGQEEGLHKWYFANGKVDQQVTYVNGKAEGEVKQWYPDGKMKAQSLFKQGKKEGKTTKWFTSGEIQATENYTNGQPDGEFKLYDKAGYLKGYQIYQNGDLMEEYAYRTGRAVIDGGFAVVYNERDVHYRINIAGDWARELDSDAVLYLVNGVFVQVLTAKTPTTADADIQKTLSIGMAEEKARIETESKRNLVISSEKGATKAGAPFLHWWFDADTKENNQAKKEHYITFWANGQFVHLYAVQPERVTDEQLNKLIMNMANSCIISKEPIDILSVR